VRLGRLLAVLAASLAFATLIEDVLAINLGIDLMFMPDYTELGNKFHPGRMSPASNMSFVLLGISIILSEKSGVGRKISQALSLIAVSVSIVALSGYIFQARPLYKFMRYIQLSEYTAMTVCLLVCSIVCAKPEIGLMKILLEKGPSGSFARRMFAATTCFPPLLGLIALLGENQGLLASSTASAVVAMSTVFFFIGIVWYSAESMQRSEKALAESESQFRTLANSISQLSWIAGPTGEIFWYNQRWYDYTGLDPADCKNWDWGPSEVQHPEHTEAVYESWKKAVSSNQPWEYTFPLRSASGSYRWFLTRALPIYNSNGEIIRWFGSNTDINDRRRFEEELLAEKEKAERASQAKTQFLANMSHEIRTPVGAIMGFSGMLREAKFSASEKEAFMLIIERNSKNLLRLIDDILDLSKVEADKIVLEHSEINLVQLLSDLNAIMKFRASEKAIAFRLHTGQNIPLIIKTDGLRLRQILTNVVGNAIKFTVKGHVELFVSYSSGELKFSVTDTGLGISSEHFDKLFKAFSQADATFSRKFGGSGLGLVLARRLSQLLGGDLRLIKTTVGRGSTFEAKIRPQMIDCKQVVPSSIHQENLAEALPALPAKKNNLKGLKLLVVEDSPDNRMLIQTYLKFSGAELTMAHDGEEALQKVALSTPDIILMDIQMPKLDGHEAIRRLRADGYLRPIIALTAHAMREERQKCFEAGCSDYLTKPIQRDHLIEVLHFFAFTDETIDFLPDHTSFIQAEM
jgi:PAS domain S-box-containing protein